MSDISVQSLTIMYNGQVQVSVADNVLEVKMSTGHLGRRGGAKLAYGGVKARRSSFSNSLRFWVPFLPMYLSVLSQKAKSR